MTKLLIGPSDKNAMVEIINLDEFEANVTCENLPNFPYETSGTTGQLYGGTMPLICNGNAQYCLCYGFVNGIWTEIPETGDCRYQSASALIKLPGANVIKLFFSSLMLLPNKLEHLFIASFFLACLISSICL
jgi:hypothetical protein